MDVALVTDDERWSGRVARALATSGFDAVSIRPADVCNLINDTDLRLVIWDAGRGGAPRDDEAIAWLEANPRVPVVLAAGDHDPDRNARLFRSRAADVGHRDHIHELVYRAERAAERARPRAEAPSGAEPIFAESPAMKELLQTLERVATSDSTLILIGESGVGKGLIAAAVHSRSPRRDGPLVSVHCASVPPALFEAELFGHEPGAFTGARESRTGRIERAHGGTLFLDGVEDMPLEAQSKLLRALDERAVEPLGAVAPRAVDVRVIAASNRDLAALVEVGAFREDLFFRLNVVPIVVPPLRERVEDIPQMAEYFLAATARRLNRRGPSLTPEARERLVRHRWPGNVRELRNGMERVATLAAGPSIGARELDFLSEARRDADRREVVDEAVSGRATLADVEAALIRLALEECGGGVTRAAERLGLTRRALGYRMKKHGIQRVTRPRTRSD